MNIKKGVFYGIGVGPGDSELITIKAVNVLSLLDVLYVPQPKKGSDSTAKKIAQPYISEVTEIRERHFPMNFNTEEKEKAWNSISTEIIEDVKKGKTVGFITLGDPMIYSTYVYLLERVKTSIEAVTIPGIPSFVNIASSNNFPLVMDRQSLGIMSCTDDLNRIGKMIDDYDSIVLMKIYRNFREIIDLVISKGLEDKAILVSRSSMDGEKTYCSLSEAKKNVSISYFSSIIINKKS